MSPTYGRSQQYYIAVVMSLNQSSLSRTLRRYRELEVIIEDQFQGTQGVLMPADDRYYLLQDLQERNIIARHFYVLSRVHNVLVSIIMLEPG